MALEGAARAPAWVGTIAAGAAAFALGWWASARRASNAHTFADSNQLLALIKARRSIFPKDYTGEEVAREHVQQMLDASNWAPTHGKTEPWRFVVMEKEAIFNFFAACNEAMREKFGAASEKYLAYQAKQDKSRKDKSKCAYVIAICMKRQALPDKLMPEWEEVAATACAVQNMHLMAASLQIASYWSSGGPLEHERVLRHLGLCDPGDRCLGLFYVGKTTDDKIRAYGKAARRGPVADKVTWLHE